MKLQVIQGVPLKPQNWKDLVHAQLEGKPLPVPVYDVPADDEGDRVPAWQTGAGFSSPGIGDRSTPWPSFGGASDFGGANPTCQTCGGRLRGEKRFFCEEPEWFVAGKPVPDGKQAGLSIRVRQMQDQQVWHRGWLAEVYRVLKPGGILKAFSGTRTSHRMAAAMEDVGFILEKETSLEAWCYASGFPKSLNLGKVLDKMAGAQREVVGYSRGVVVEDAQGFGGIARGGVGILQKAADIPVTAPATELAKTFEGYGTALKPAFEPFICGRKPVSEPLP